MGPVHPPTVDGQNKVDMSRCPLDSVSWWPVVDGEVEVTKHGADEGALALRRLGPGECFGEIALVSDQPRSATVRSVTSVNVLAVDREAFHTLFSHLPPLRRFFEQLVETRLKGLGEEMA